MSDPYWPDRTQRIDFDSATGSRWGEPDVRAPVLAHPFAPEAFRFLPTSSDCEGGAQHAVDLTKI
jgi:hypothetical protein